MNCSSPYCCRVCALSLALQGAVVPLVQPPRAAHRAARAGRPSRARGARSGWPWSAPRCARRRGAGPPRRASPAAAAPRLRPSRDRPTSTQPVNRPSEFQTLSPCRSSTNVTMASQRSARRAGRPVRMRLPAPRRDPGRTPPPPNTVAKHIGNMHGRPGVDQFRRCMPVPRPYPRRIATVSVHTSPLEQPGPATQAA